MTELYDPKVEHTLTSTLVTYPEALRIAEPDIEPDYFRDSRCKAIVEGLFDLYQRGQSATPTLLADTLLQLGKLEQAGGTERINGLFNNGAEPPAAVGNLVSIVRDHWRRRQEITLSQLIGENAQNRSKNGDDRLGAIKEKLKKLESTLAETAGRDTESQFNYYLNLLDEREKTADKPRLQLPWGRLQHYVPPLPAGCLCGVLGNPGAGKTALLENISEHWWQQGFNGIYYHAEDSPAFKLDRRMARWAGIPYHRFGKKLESGEYKAINKTWAMIERWPGELVLVHCPGWSMRKIIAHATRLCQERKVDYVMIDYLNKLAWDDRGVNINSAQMRGWDIETFKDFLERLGLVGLLAGQFDKSSKGRHGRELSDLRDSGELDDKAQVGLIIERKKNTEGKWESLGQIRVSKCNFGQTGAVWMHFVGERYLFTDRPEQE